jgi:peptidoglycan/LPS O-acetylase OafA/YrhL
MDLGKGGRFRELDVLRGLAAMSVVFFHYSRHGTRYLPAYPFDFWIGEYGVHLFFVISGFVIHFTLERSRTLADFAFSRFSRLYPSYWAALVLLFLVQTLFGAEGTWLKAYLVNLTMLQKFVHFQDVDNLYWTLAVELAFYIVMALVYVRGQLRRMPIIGTVWLLIAAAWALTSHSPGAQDYSFQTTFLILPFAPYFIAGSMFYLIHSQGPRAPPVAVILLALLVAGLIWGLKIAAITAGIFGLLAMALAGWLAFLVSPVTLWLGAISYPLYLVHRMPGYYALNAMDARQVPQLLALAIAVAGAMLVAHLLSVFVERPAMRKLRRWYATKTGRALAQPASG